jgi:hypothetical protein
MDPVKNPYAPGAGTPPPELAGRDELRETIRIALERVRAVRPTKSILMVGLRGVGKTVLLDRRDGWVTPSHTPNVYSIFLKLVHFRGMRHASPLPSPQATRA